MQQEGVRHFQSEEIDKFRQMIKDVPSYFRHNYGVRLGLRNRCKIVEASNRKLYIPAVSILRLFNSRGGNINTNNLKANGCHPCGVMTKSASQFQYPVNAMVCHQPG